MDTTAAEKTVEILYDHYKDTFAHIREYTAERNRLSVYVLVLVGLMHLVGPAQAPVILHAAVKERLGLDAPLAGPWASTVLWVAVLYVIVRYFQLTLTIDLQYDYLHGLEERVNKAADASLALDRERRGYGSDFRGFRRVASGLFRGVFPALMLCLLLQRLVAEYLCPGRLTLSLFADSVVFAATVLMTALYVFESYRASRTPCQGSIHGTEGGSPPA